MTKKKSKKYPHHPTQFPCFYKFIEALHFHATRISVTRSAWLIRTRMTFLILEANEEDVAAGPLYPHYSHRQTVGAIYRRGPAAPALLLRLQIKVRGPNDF